MYSLFKPSRWRYERKFVLVELAKHELEAIIKQHPAMFSEIYNERQVNNIYLDTIGLNNYFDNEVGTSKRLKVRIRWYGKLFGVAEKPYLEIKIKDGFLGSKISYPLEFFEVSKSLSINHIHRIIENSEMISKMVKSHLISLNFTLLNCYSRSYFRSADNKFRVTIDSNLIFYKIDQRENTYMNYIKDRVHTILELKYDRLFDDEAEKISTYFPFRLSKSSKYVSGISIHSK